ncbi:CsgE family curli-type amyloid fiber assembly protein [Ancylomarina sp. YFZ004]
MKILYLIFCWCMLINTTIPPDTLKTSSKQQVVPKELKEFIKKMEQIKKMDQKKISNQLDVEIDGLLVDETKTKSGRDFYELFYNNWTAPKSAKNYSITIKELPFRLRTTQIKIFINENLVYFTILQPRYDLVEAYSKDAVQKVMQYLINYDQIQQLLIGEDQKGNGIY